MFAPFAGFAGVIFTGWPKDGRTIDERSADDYEAAGAPWEQVVAFVMNVTPDEIKDLSIGGKKDHTIPERVLARAGLDLDATVEVGVGQADRGEREGPDAEETGL